MAKQNDNAGKADYTEASATEMIKRNGGTIAAKAIAHRQPGIKVWGAIDYLVSTHKYRWNKGD